MAPTSDKRQATSDKRQATSDKRQATSDKRQATSDKRQATSLSRVDKLREKLLRKLDELFELDQPDLDFGFYRIMHAKADEVRHFIEHDLLHIIDDAFGQNANNSIAKAKAEYEQALAQAESFGAPDPENTPAVRQAKTAYEQVRDRGSDEAQVYDHLYRFFERYYEDGDFISRRYYTQETAGRAAPYAIPYNGEEVKLHWANADQYYIKSTEYFNNFTFDLAQAKELQQVEPKDQASLDLDDKNTPTGPLRVHFQIVDAQEGEHGNVKAADDNKREFFLHHDNPVARNAAGELVVNFEYRNKVSSDNLSKSRENIVKSAFDCKSGVRSGDLPNLVLTYQILEAAKALTDLNPEYIQYLTTLAPTDKIRQRPLLAKYINNYTRRNTADYFIHKDLGGFLRRELDFYIKNEVMRLDDIENADAPTVESYLGKIKVLRQIAHQLIDFLAQLENFQKKLWLKKKFVTETNYCITLDRVPRSLYPQILANEAQHQEWVDLFAIDEIKDDLAQPAYSNPLTLEFLEANQNLVLDTQFFGEAFKNELIANIHDLDEQCDGLLIHSENFQALQILQARYREQVKCIYFDPPYNTGNDGFIYKDNYQHSSWISLIHDRLLAAKSTLMADGWLFISIDEREYYRLMALIEDVYGDNVVSTITVKMSHLSGMKMSNVDRKPPKVKEYLVMVAANTTLSKINPEYERSTWGEVFDRYSGFLETDPKDETDFTQWTRINVNQKAKSLGIDIEDEKAFEEWAIKNSDFIFRTAVNDSKAFKDTPNDGKFRKITTPTGLTKYVYKREEVLFSSSYLKNIDGERVPARIVSDIWTDIGINNLHNEGGVQFQNGKKPLKLIERVIKMADSGNGIVLDFFAGSGTTAHAVITLNRAKGKRKFICVEQGDHFNDVLLGRTAKAYYSKDWILEKPTSRKGESGFFKYIRLESYEDTLNNLRFKNDPIRQRALANNMELKEDYMLNYMLDVETRGSQSLLNVDGFKDPTAYRLNLKQPGSDAHKEQTIDLIETFHYLIGLRLDHMAAPQRFSASFTREVDPDAPQDQTTRLVLKDRLKEDKNGAWWLRKIEGWVPADPANPNNGLRDKVLIIWRKLTGDLEQDNLVLDEYFKALRISTRDFEYDTIYVNGSNNLPNLKTADDQWKVRLLEEEFHRRMWDVEG